MNNKNIGIMGGLVCNENMGCVALTYSLLSVLEKISNKYNYNFRYTIFEYNYSEECYSRLSKKLNIKRDNLKFSKIAFYENENWKLFLKTINEKHKMIKDIKNCDVVIDITQGDSFTDIYGQGRFDSLTHIKEIVLKNNIPLILAPQTYGPFMSEDNKSRAKKVIEKSTLVLSRDKQSADFLNSFCSKDVTVATDLAFGLPYDKTKSINNKLKIGLNPSGLLIKNKTEGTNLSTSLKTDYDEYIKRLTDILLNKYNCELHIIPHVGEDATFLYQNNNNVIIHNKFLDPIEAKNVISKMDIFIGSRMHATVGAFSSGVATVPVAYSCKFSGLYNNLGYEYIIDLTTLNTEEALNKTIELIEEKSNLKTKVNECMSKIDSVYKIIETALDSTLVKVLNY